MQGCGPYVGMNTLSVYDQLLPRSDCQINLHTTSNTLVDVTFQELNVKRWRVLLSLIFLILLTWKSSIASDITHLPLRMTRRQLGTSYRPQYQFTTTMSKGTAWHHTTFKFWGSYDRGKENTSSSDSEHLSPARQWPYKLQKLHTRLRR